jgi:hypothetical protein
MISNSKYDSIGYFVQTTIIILSTPPYFEIVDNVFNFIETNFTDEERDVVISMLAKRIDDIENIDSKARLLKFIQDHRKDDCDGPKIVL